MLRRCILVVFLVVVFSVPRDCPVVGKRGRLNGMRRDPEEDAETTGEAQVPQFRGEGSPGRGDYDAGDRAVLRQLFGRSRPGGFVKDKCSEHRKLCKSMIPKFGYPFMYWTDWRDLALQYQDEYPEEEEGEEEEEEEEEQQEQHHETRTRPSEQQKKMPADYHRMMPQTTAESSSLSSVILWWLLFVVSLILLTILIAWIICILCCKELLEDYQNPPVECRCGETRILINKGTSTDQDKSKASSKD